MTQMVCALQLCLAKNKGFMKNIQHQIYGILVLLFNKENFMKT